MKIFVLILSILVVSACSGSNRSGNKNSPQPPVPEVSCLQFQHIEDGQCVNNARDCNLVNGIGLEDWSNGSWTGRCVPTTCNVGYILGFNKCNEIEQVTEISNGSTTCQYNVETDDYLDCVTVCNQNFHLNEGSCVSNVDSCDIVNGLGQKNWNNGWGDCLPISCDNGFHIESNQCLNNVRSCIVQNGTGIESWINGAWSGACVVIACNEGFTLGQNQCNPSQTTYVIDHGSKLCTYLTDISDYGNCSVSCDSDYHADQLTCKSNIESCVIANGTGTHTWNNGWGLCYVESCNSDYMNLANYCVLVNQTRPFNDEIGGGIESSVDGGQNWIKTYESCLSLDFHVETGLCKPNTRSADATELLGLNASEATAIWGGEKYVYTIISCNAGRHLSNNACDPNTIALSTAEKIEISSLSAAVPLTVVNSTKTAESNIVMGQPQISTLSGVGSTAISDIKSTSTENAQVLSLMDGSVDVTVSSSGTSSCSFVNPFESIPCIINGTLTLMRSTLISLASGNSSLVAKDGDLYSNEILIKKYSIKQITSTNTTYHDVPKNFIVYNNSLYFSSASASYQKMFKFDGTTVKKIYNNVGNSSENIMYPVIYGSDLVFRAVNSGHAAKTFKHNGTTFSQIADTTGNAATNDYGSNYVVYNDNLYFTSTNASGFTKLFRYNGTETVQISNLNESGNDDVDFSTVYGNALYFAAQDSSGKIKLFKYCDGLAGCGNQGYSKISNLNLNNHDSPKYLYVHKNELFFIALSGANFKLFKFDGSQISQLSNLNSGHDFPVGTNCNSLYSGCLPYFKTFKDELYFVARNSSSNSKMFKYTGNMITQVGNTRESSFDDSAHLTVYNDELYFGSKNPTDAIKLYKYNGSKVFLVTDIRGSNLTDNPEFLTVFNGALYFSAYNSAGVSKLFELK